MNNEYVNILLRSCATFLKKILPSKVYKIIVNGYIAWLKLINWTRLLLQTRVRVFFTGPHPIRYYPDGMWTYAGNSFDDDPRFQAAWDRIHKHVGNIRTISWRLHVVLALAEYCSHLEGDFVECGTFRGINAHGISAFLDFKRIAKKFY